MRSDLALLSLALVLLLAWDASALDLTIARWYGGPAGFEWRDRWLTSTVLHDGARALAWAVVIALAVNVWRPLPGAGDLPARTRLWWLATTLGCVLLVSLIKRWSLTSCPWALAEFGGVARFVSHWDWGVADGGGGQCFPSGHASSAFALLAGSYALRSRHPRAARAWTVIVVAAGLLLGWAQAMRGAHFASHTLWTAWICWAATATASHAAARLKRHAGHQCATRRHGLVRSKRPS